MELTPRVQALLRALGMRKEEPVEDRADTARAGAEEISKVLPSPVMPREAVLKKRKQMEEMDRMLRESER